MAPLKCCIGGCNATSETHRLFCVPKDDNLRRLWMEFLVPTNSSLIGLTTSQWLRKRVCQRHFDRRQLDGQGKRTRFSYPCLFTPKEIAHGIPLSTEEYHVLSEHNYHQSHEDNDINENDETSLISRRADGSEHIYEHSYCLTTTMASSIPKRKDAGVHLNEYSNPSSLPAIPSCSNNRMYSKMSTSTSTQKSKVIYKTNKAASVKRKFVQRVQQIAAKSMYKSGLQRLQTAKKICTNSLFLQNFEALNKQAKTLLTMQLNLVGKHTKARRFNMEEKIIALSLMKQSPKGYKLLEKMFSLPTKRTLNRLSEKISFEPGINNKVLKYVQELTKTWDRKKKLCSITFDEISLSPHLTFNEAKDIIDGFVEVGQERKLKYCDHALVFMIRGICSSWRQSVAYYFCEGTVSATELIQILKYIVFHVAQTGLIPLALVCDQGSTFRSALQSIRKDTIRSRNAQAIRDDGTVEVAGITLNIFFDPPHLLKSIRNNFITKDLVFNGNIGTWKDIIFIFDIDSRLGHTRALPKLTAHHVMPNKIKKMKVSAATQVLSARTAAMLKYTNALNIRNTGVSQNSTMGTTAEIVEFFDSLFDSVNGSPGCSKQGKLRSAVRRGSQHVEIWQKAICTFKNMQYRDCTSKLAMQTGQPRLLRVPCLEGWITTLESFIRITKLLFTEYEVEYYYPRYINQDPLENFFGRIRAINYRNVNPDAHAFSFSFKALILSNILSPHSKFSNCEEDNGETLIDLNFLFQDDKSNKENMSETIFSIPSTSQESLYRDNQDLRTQVLMEKIGVQCSAYAAGFLCRKISQSVNCAKCLKTYTTTEVDSIHEFIKFREYKKLKNNNLAYPNKIFLRLYREASQHIHTYLNTYCHQRHIGKNISNILHKHLHFTWLGCTKHKRDVIQKFIIVTIRMQVHNWCKIINKILKGAIEGKYVNRMKEPQKMALKKYEKIKLKKRVINKIKNLNH